MKNQLIPSILIAASLGLTLPAMAAGMNGAGTNQSSEKISHGIGVLKDIDLKQSTILLAHEPIEELHWSAMTMAFKVTDAKQLKGLTVGQKVAFDLKGSGMSPVVIAIRPVK
jgi:Cu(I)/Ag(I) efflux system periplasmic protein CusF